eukprot:g5762.t1
MLGGSRNVGVLRQYFDLLGPYVGSLTITTTVPRTAAEEQFSATCAVVSVAAKMKDAEAMAAGRFPGDLSAEEVDARVEWILDRERLLFSNEKIHGSRDANADGAYYFSETEVGRLVGEFGIAAAAGDRWSPWFAGRPFLEGLPRDNFLFRFGKEVVLPLLRGDHARICGSATVNSHDSDGDGSHWTTVTFDAAVVDAGPEEDEDEGKEQGGDGDGGETKTEGKEDAEALARLPGPPQVVQVYPLGDGGASFQILSGNILGFDGAGVGREACAIVNAANTGCLGGGGVDGAITEQGGPALRAARRDLPVVPGAGPATAIAFPLLSVGAFCGDRKRRDLIRVGLLTILAESEDMGDLQTVCLVGFHPSEVDDLRAVAQEVFCSEGAAVAAPAAGPAGSGGGGGAADAAEGGGAGGGGGHADAAEGTGEAAGDDQRVYNSSDDDEPPPGPT